MIQLLGNLAAFQRETIDNVSLFWVIMWGDEAEIATQISFSARIVGVSSGLDPTPAQSRLSVDGISGLAKVDRALDVIE